MSDQPFRSEAQRKKWDELLQAGKVSQESYDARVKASEGLTLPPRAAPRVRTVGPSRAPTMQKLDNRRY
jgi:hypothetical protein